MSLTEHSDLKIREKVTRIQSISEETSSNGNDYVLVEDTSGAKFYVWNDGWQSILMDEAEFYRSRTVRINYVAEDPPYYCVLRHLYPVDWDDSKPEEKDFEVTFDVTNDDTLNANDVPREERIVNQAATKFSSEMLKIKQDDIRQQLKEEGDSVDFSEEELDEAFMDEMNKWISRFRRAAITGELE